MMTDNKTNPGYFNSLTGVRAVAAFMVYIHHWNPFEISVVGAYTHDYFNYFFSGVAVFFVLSGFLITYRYIDSFELSRSWFKVYILNRVARIFPMYFILTTCTFIIAFVNGEYAGNTGHGILVYILNITLLRGFFKDFLFSGVGQGWSLTVEECFYLTAPFAFYIYLRYRKLFIQPAIFISIGLLLIYVCSFIDFYGLFEGYNFTMRMTFFGRCLEFYMGMRLAIIFKKHGTNTTPRYRLNYTYTGAIGTLVAIGLTHFDFPYYILSSTVLPFFICVFFYGLLTEQSQVKKLLSTKLFIILGKSSYIFYLIHVGFIQDWVFHNTGIFNGLGITYLARFVILNIISIILYKIIEAPLHTYIKGLYTRKRVAIAV
jgi:peptidoglycan/LPS O-acetylase OafA/YrhL